MRFEYNPYIWLLIISALISFSLGLFSLLLRRHVVYTRCFALNMFIVTIWSAGNALEMSGSDFATKLFWANIQYFAYCYSPVTLLILCMQFTGYDKWVKNRRALFLAALPTVSVILVWTDRLHGLMRYNMRMDYSGAFPVIAKEYGPFFYVHAIYSHVLNISAIIMLLGAVFYRKTIYRKQATVLMIGAIMIVIPNVLYIFGIGPIRGFDITPLFFGPAGFLMYWSIFRYKMLGLMPIAITTVMERMESGVMVMDLQGKALEINPVFGKLTDFNVSEAFAHDGTDICKSIPVLSKACADKSISQIEFSKQVDSDLRFYMALFSQIKDSKDRYIGRLVLIHDITKKKKSEQVFLEHQWQLAINKERERVARNLHDDLGQVLGFMNFQAQGVRQELVNAGIEVGLQGLDKLVKTAQAAHDELRTFIRESKDLTADKNDFIKSLNNLIGRFEMQSGIETRIVTIDSFSPNSLEPSKIINMLYITKEALNNVQKHSHAKHADISLTASVGMLYLTIADNGIGFDLSKSSIDRNSFGLDIMRERATEMGGNLYIESYPGKGTKIKASIPFKGSDRP